VASGGPVDETGIPTALVAGMPRRHLDSAAETCRIHGRVAIPAGSPGDLDSATPGIEVLVIVTGSDEVPAATWRAAFVRRVEAPPGEVPHLVPPTWVEERATAPEGPGSTPHRDPDVADEADDDEDGPGPQSFFEVEGLEELPKHAWVFANELVGKQQRGGRVFVPRAPRLVRRPA
jgi:hypothetical protein